jgi:hypothetical protein
VLRPYNVRCGGKIFGERISKSTKNDANLILIGIPQDGEDRVRPAEFGEISGETSWSPEHPLDPLGKPGRMLLKMGRRVNALCTFF